MNDENEYFFDIDDEDESYERKGALQELGIDLGLVKISPEQRKLRRDQTLKEVIIFIACIFLLQGIIFMGFHLADISESADAIKLGVGESEYLSGRVQIGKDIESGIYDLEIDGDTPCTIIFYESKSDMDTEDQIPDEPPKEEELYKDRRVLKNYRLDKGNVLELNGNNIKFTKVR